MKIKLILKSIIAVFMLVVSFTAVAQWQGPTQKPPEGNTFSPINISSNIQRKAGSLVIGGGLGVENIAVFDSTVGIGTGNVLPTAELEVNGLAKVSGFKMTPGAGANYVLTSDANGVGTWQPNLGGPGGNGGGNGAVSSVFGRTGDVLALTGDYTVAKITGAAPINNPNFTGIVTIPSIKITGSSPALDKILVATDTLGNTTWKTPASLGLVQTLSGDVTGNQVNGNIFTTIASGAVTNSKILSGTIVATDKLSATGTKNSTTYLRGDNTWATVSGGGITGIGTLDGKSRNANGATIDGNNLHLQTADKDFPGLISTGYQEIKGQKLFLTDGIYGFNLTVNGDLIATSAFNQTNSSGTFFSKSISVTFDTLKGSGTRCVQADSTGRLTTTGGGCGSSDFNLKKDIFDTKYGLSTVLSLRPVDFKWKETSASDVGFIAQDVKKIVPEIVYGKEGSMSIGYNSMTAILTKAIQEQQIQIEELKKEIELLKLNK